MRVCAFRSKEFFGSVARGRLTDPLPVDRGRLGGEFFLSYTRPKQTRHMSSTCGALPM
jgi:hypothetical protein